MSKGEIKQQKTNINNIFTFPRNNVDRWVLCICWNDKKICNKLITIRVMKSDIQSRSWLRHWVKRWKGTFNLGALQSISPSFTCHYEGQVMFFHSTRISGYLYYSQPVPKIKLIKKKKKFVIKLDYFQSAQIKIAIIEQVFLYVWARRNIFMVIMP